MKEYTLKDFLPSIKIDDIRGWKISFDWDLDDKKAILYKAGEVIDKASISPDITKEILIELVAPISAVYSFSRASFERYNSISYINKRIDALHGRQRGGPRKTHGGDHKRTFGHLQSLR